MKLQSAIKAINERGILLVYPINNRPEPASLWSYFYPRSEMRWEWDDSGDNRVANLWHLREQLSESGKVVYAKWYQGRATFFSREVFIWMLALLESERALRRLGPDARVLYEQLDLDSPLSTKVLKKQSGLSGRANERAYERAMKELWSRLLVVGYGEVDEGAFPSLAMGASRVLFEDLWKKARSIAPDEARAALTKKLGPHSLFLKHERKLSAPPRARAVASAIEWS